MMAAMTISSVASFALEPTDGQPVLQTATRKYVSGFVNLPDGRRHGRQRTHAPCRMQRLRPRLCDFPRYRTRTLGMRQNRATPRSERRSNVSDPRPRIGSSF